MKIHLINNKKIGAEFGFYTKQAKLREFIRKIVSFYDFKNSVYIFTICGLNFNVEKLILSLSENAEVIEDAVCNTKTEDSNIITRIIIVDSFDFEVCLSYINKFSEGSFRMQVFNVQDDDSLSKIDKLLGYTGDPLLTVEIFSDATYIEITSKSEFPRQLMEYYGLNN